MLAHIAIPVSVTSVLTMAALSTISLEICEAAEVDGASLQRRTEAQPYGSNRTSDRLPAADLRACPEPP